MDIAADLSKWKDYWRREYIWFSKINQYPTRGLDLQENNCEFLSSHPIRWGGWDYSGCLTREGAECRIKNDTAVRI